MARRRAPRETPDPTARAQALWMSWVDAARNGGYTPGETMIALTGGIAEMIRHNCPASTWDDHLDTVRTEIRYILTGISPEDEILNTKGETRAHEPRPEDRQPDQPERSRPSEDVHEDDPGEPGTDSGLPH